MMIEGPAGPLEIRIAGIDKAAIEKDTFDEKDTSGKFKLEKFSLEKATSKRIGIICHPHPLYQGSMDNKVVTTMVRAWLNLGLATVRFNFRGVGKSAGSYGEGKGEIEDLKAVINWVENVTATSPNTSTEIWLGGFSFGTYIAASVAAEKVQENKIKALLTISPPVQHFAFDELFQKFSLPSCPWLVIQGDQDEVVPCDKVISWFQKFHDKKEDLKLVIMPGASHFFHGRLIELQKIIEEEMLKFL